MSGQTPLREEMSTDVRAYWLFAFNSLIDAVFLILWAGTQWGAAKILSWMALDVGVRLMVGIGDPAINELLEAL